MTKKVYCKNCHHSNKLHIGGATIPSWIAYSCNYIIDSTIYNDYDSKHIRYIKKPAAELNKNNNCQYYQEKNILDRLEDYGIISVSVAMIGLYLIYILIEAVV